MSVHLKTKKLENREAEMNIRGSEWGGEETAKERRQLVIIVSTSGVLEVGSLVNSSATQQSVRCALRVEHLLASDQVIGRGRTSMVAVHQQSLALEHWPLLLLHMVALRDVTTNDTTNETTSTNENTNQ